MKNEHWIIYHETQDPPGIHIVAVRHTPEEAQEALENAAHEKAQQANMVRKTLFKKGQSCGRVLDASDFSYHYVTAHVKGTA